MSCRIKIDLTISAPIFYWTSCSIRKKEISAWYIHPINHHLNQKAPPTGRSNRGDSRDPSHGLENNFLVHLRPLLIMGMYIQRKSIAA